ncbi:MBL fold metallo-hydrolase, partial [Clostridioides difficile]
MFIKKSSMGVMLALCFMLILSACAGTASKTENAEHSNAASAGNTKSEETNTPAVELKVITYNPGENSIFGVSSNLIEGPTEVVLVDAQFQKNDAEQ